MRTQKSEITISFTLDKGSIFTGRQSELVKIDCVETTHAHFGAAIITNSGKSPDTIVDAIIIFPSNVGILISV